MRFAVFANVYDCPYFGDWRKAMFQQSDQGFDILYFTISELNESLARACVNYDALLFLDIDDIPHFSLVANAKRYARENDVTAIGMKMVDENNEITTGIFGKMVDINKYNVWGFGNTVYRTRAISPALPVYGDPIDWAFARAVRDAGFELHFEPLPLINYRQYGQNKRLVEIDDRYVWR